MEKICKNCDYYVNHYGYGQCYGQKNAPRVDDNECCDSFKEYSGSKEQLTVTNKLKTMLEEEFDYRKRYGKTVYTYDEIRCVISQVFNEFKFENK